jgi:hypothetical protein
VPPRRGERGKILSEDSPSLAIESRKALNVPFRRFIKPRCSLRSVSVLSEAWGTGPLTKGVIDEAMSVCREARLHPLCGAPDYAESVRGRSASP